MKASGSLVLLAVLFSSGCGTYRGIPTHGGGKRFDEEQRIVAGAIRQAIGDMELAELRTKKVRIALESIAHDGGGTINWPGLQSVGVGGSLSRNVMDANQPWTSQVTNLASANGSLSYQVSPGFYPAVFSTQPDLAYLKGVLEMKLRMDGIVLNDAQPETVLFVLVDILGTNRSRTDKLLEVDDDYEASCELTYYAIDALSGQIVFRGRQAGALARYDEKHMLIPAQTQVQRSVSSLQPTLPPVGAATASVPQGEAATRPALASVAPAAAYQATIQPPAIPLSPPAGN